jgi:protein gp37
MARRLDGQGVGYDGTTKASEAGSRMAGAYWTGRVNWLPERLEVPLRWRKPRSVFVCSMADLFHEELSFPQIAAVFGVMATTPRHTYQVLTKRASRMLEFFDWLEGGASSPASIVADHADEELINLGRPVWERDIELAPAWPLPNVWLGVSVEDQKRLYPRLHHLMDTPAAVRFLSCEPLLGPLDFEDGPLSPESTMGTWSNLELGSIHWIIAGGESGAGARPPHPAWFRKLRDDATEAGVAFFFKQWGAWAPYIESLHSRSHRREELEDGVEMVCIGKKRAGRKLDGRTWDETPSKEDSNGKT